MRDPADNTWYDYSTNAARFPWISAYSPTAPTTNTYQVAISYGMPASNTFADLNAASLAPTTTFDLRLTVQDAILAQTAIQTWQVTLEDLCYR